MTGPPKDVIPREPPEPQPVFIIVPVEEDYVTLLTKTPQGTIAITKVRHENLIIARDGEGRWDMSKRTEQRVAWGFAAMLIIAMLVLAVFIPDPKPFQYTVFRIVLAIAIAGLAAMIPGFLEITLSNWLRAGGALAVFVIVFFFSPAQLVVEKQADKAPASSSPTSASPVPK
jgi:hypothetical protein